MKAKRKSAAARTLPLPGVEPARTPRPFVLYLRLSTAERERFAAAARLADLPLSTWARHALLRCKGAER